MNIEKLVNDFNEAKKVLKENINQSIKESTQGLFEKYPDLRIGMVSWIPSFNDGDPCTYTSPGWMGYIQKPDSEEEYSDEQLFAQEDYDSDDFIDLPEEVEDVISSLNKIPSEIEEEIFGYNVTTVITKDGMSQEEYYCGY